jgi:ribosomal protein L25 (general stress protein Ctc)
MPAKKPKKETTASLKKSGAEKLRKIGKTTDVAHISYGVRHGKITVQEAAALDPKNFKHLLDNSKTTKTITINIKTGKAGRGGAGGAFLENLK